MSLTVLQTREQEKLPSVSRCDFCFGKDFGEAICGETYSQERSANEFCNPLEDSPRQGTLPSISPAPAPLTRSLRLNLPLTSRAQANQVVSYAGVSHTD